jgi:hypothetical protein
MAALRRGTAPPGLLGCARRRQRYGVRQNHQIRSWKRGRTQLPSSVGYESKGWLWFNSVLSLALALPQGSIQTRAQCCDPRSAAGARPDSDCTGPFGALPMRLLRSWSALRRSFSGNSSLPVVDGGAWGNLTPGAASTVTVGSAPYAHAACSAPMIRTSCHAQARRRRLLSTAAKYFRVHHQPEAALLAPRGRWAQSPGPASCVARAGHAT